MRKRKKKPTVVARTAPVKRKKRAPRKKSAIVKKKSKIPRTINSNTQTPAMFWGMIRAALRRLSMIRWQPTKEVRERARIPYVGPNKKRKYSYVCQMCAAVVDAKSCAVHHLEPCGSLMCAADVEGFVTRLFCEKEKLMLICNSCHDKVHEKEKEETKK